MNALITLNVSNVNAVRTTALNAINAIYNRAVDSVDYQIFRAKQDSILIATSLINIFRNAFEENKIVWLDAAVRRVNELTSIEEQISIAYDKYNREFSIKNDNVTRLTGRIAAIPAELNAAATNIAQNNLNTSNAIYNEIDNLKAINNAKAAEVEANARLVESEAKLDIANAILAASNAELDIANNELSLENEKSKLYAQNYLDKQIYKLYTYIYNKGFDTSIFLSNINIYGEVAKFEVLPTRLINIVQNIIRQFNPDIYQQ